MISIIETYCKNKYAPGDKFDYPYSESPAIIEITSVYFDFDQPWYCVNFNYKDPRDTPDVRLYAQEQIDIFSSRENNRWLKL